VRSPEGKDNGVVRRTSRDPYYSGRASIKQINGRAGVIMV